MEREEVYDRVMARHKDAVYRQIARVCGNYDDAQDVLVETMLAAYRSMDQVRDPDAMRAWLATIGRRICRRMKARDALSPIIALGEEGAYMPHWEEELENDRMRDCIHTALQTLPPTYREVYELRCIQGIPAAEAAEMLGIEITNLKSRLHRARAKVREAFDHGICGHG